MHQADRQTITREPVSSIKLMERAAMAFTNFYCRRFDQSRPVAIFSGHGNNGGDALAIARMLMERNYNVRVYLLSNSNLSEDCRQNLSRLKYYLNPEVLQHGRFPQIYPEDVIIDGLFGSGLNRPVEGFAASLIRYINEQARTIVSIDIPSGLSGEDNREYPGENIIKADITFTFGMPFLSFFMKENEIYTGRWECLDIGLHQGAVDEINSSYFLVDRNLIKGLLKPREKFSHKGHFGHALIIAGTCGMMGAAVLAAKSCLRGGAGLTTLCVPGCGIDIIQVSAPEALTFSGGSEEHISLIPGLSSYHAIGIGPALGFHPETEDMLRNLLENSSIPLVLDADALTILSRHSDWIPLIPAGSVITPHPGEFDRLTGSTGLDMYSRHLKQTEFAQRYNLVVILKGANTITCLPDGTNYINVTGNPGMASGGSGDVLTGLLVSLIARGYSTTEAAILSVYLHGLAGDLASSATGMEAMTAGDLVQFIGKAFLCAGEEPDELSNF